MGRPPLKKGAIERSALELFVEKGVDGTSIRDIAQRAGVTEGALYRHHRSKDDLVRHLYLQSFTHFGEIMEALASTSTSPSDRIRLMIAQLVELHARDSYVFRYVLVLNHHLLKEVRVGERDFVAALARAIGGPSSDFIAQLVLGIIVQVSVAVESAQLPGKLADYSPRLIAAAMELVGKPL
ncbi:TetR family transcriptional regulator [bacterium]|nr:TetR family transcriptional regulator [bacterium]